MRFFGGLLPCLGVRSNALYCVLYAFNNYVAEEMLLRKKCFTYLTVVYYKVILSAIKNF